jgi:hypothetical protein
MKNNDQLHFAKMILATRVEIEKCKMRKDTEELGRLYKVLNSIKSSLRYENMLQEADYTLDSYINFN